MEPPLEIFHVDDNPSDLELTAMAMDDVGRAVTYRHTLDGRSFLDFLLTKADGEGVPPPDLVILDVNMPEMNGIDILAEMRRRDLVDRIPVVMLTTSPKPDDARLCTELGARAFLIKPDGYEDLVTLARKLVDLASAN